MDSKQILKDATAAGMLAASGGLFVLRACRSDGALERAAHNAVNSVAVAAPLAGSAFFVAGRTSGKTVDREDALKVASIAGGLVALAAGVVGGIVSLAWDAFRS